MRHSHKKLFVDAMVQHAIRKTKSRRHPMVFMADRFFMDACDKFVEEKPKMEGGEPTGEQELVPRELVHPFSRNDHGVILRKFFDEFQRRCLGKDISVIKASKKLVILGEVIEDNGRRRTITLHNKEAIVNDVDRTDEFFRSRAMLTRNNPAVGFVLFGPQCRCPDHPLLQTSLEQRQAPTQTMVDTYDRLIKNGIDRGLISPEYASELAIESPVRKRLGDN